jgi:hypothetical protein
MKRLLFFLAMLSIPLLACNISATNTPGGGPETPAAETPAVAETSTVAETPLPAATSTPSPNVVCNELSFYLDPAVASSFGCETVPEVSGADLAFFEIHPQHTKVTLYGYVLSDRFMTPQILVFPVQRYREILPDVINARLPALQALIAGGAPGGAALPLLPVFPAAEMFTAQYAVVPFQSGSGIRYITEYHQAYYTVNNHDIFLSFQGLTADGRFWVSVILPISHPSLSEISEPNIPEADAATYYANMTAQLNAQPPESFIPSILALDALINSIIISA